MKNFFYRLFSFKKTPTISFGEFLRTAPEAEKKRVINEAIRGANQDQRDLVDKFNKMNKKTA